MPPWSNDLEDWLQRSPAVILQILWFHDLQVLLVMISVKQTKENLKCTNLFLLWVQAKFVFLCLILWFAQDSQVCHPTYQLKTGEKLLKGHKTQRKKISSGIVTEQKFKQMMPIHIFDSPVKNPINICLTNWCLAPKIIHIKLQIRFTAPCYDIFGGPYLTFEWFGIHFSK